MHVYCEESRGGMFNRPLFLFLAHFGFFALFFFFFGFNQSSVTSSVSVTPHVPFHIHKSIRSSR